MMVKLILLKLLVSTNFKPLVRHICSSHTPPKCSQKDLRNKTFTKFSKMTFMKYLIILKMENQKFFWQFQIYNAFVYYFSYIQISVNSDPDVTEIAHKTGVSPKLSVNFLFYIFYVIRHFIQVILENLVKVLFLKSFCKHLGGVLRAFISKNMLMLIILTVAVSATILLQPNLTKFEATKFYSTTLKKLITMLLLSLSLLVLVLMLIRPVRRGVSKWEEDGCRPPALRAGHPQTAMRPFGGWPARRA
jgi:hypothetical protein